MFLFYSYKIFWKRSSFGKKVWWYQLQNWKNPRKWTCIACGYLTTSGSLQKGRLYVYLYELFPKVVIHLLVPFACGIRELHATQIMFCNIPPREIKSKYKNGATFNKFMNPSAILILIKAYPIKPLSGQPIWFDYTFKGLFPDLTPSTV